MIDSKSQHNFGGNIRDKDSHWIRPSMQVTPSLFFKTSPRTKTFKWRWVWFPCIWTFRRNSTLGEKIVRVALIGLGHILLLRPSPRCPKGILQQIWFHSKNAANIFRPHYNEETWKSKNQRSFGFVSHMNGFTLRLVLTRRQKSKWKKAGWYPLNSVYKIRV